MVTGTKIKTFDLFRAIEDGQKKIAALFVQTGGVYFGLHGVDPWDEQRDAMKYSGDEPVIAHPPCQLWGKFAKVNYARWGGDHNKPGNDGGKFKFALDAVNRCGGVLEHPKASYAWKAHGLIKPEKGKWIKSGRGYVCEVYQSTYGHKAKKATWLYYVGPAPINLDWRETNATHQIGYRDYTRSIASMLPTVTAKEAIGTPTAFRDALIKLVRSR